MQPIKHAVIIAAGRGTRMRPSTRVVPKEFLQNFDRPLIHHAIEEAMAVGATQITVVTSGRSEPFLERYFAPLDADEATDPRFEGLASILDQCEVRWVRQPEAKGTGNATLYARDAGVDAPFLLILPDLVYPEGGPGPELADTVARLGGNALSVTEVGTEYFDSWGIVDGPEVEPGVVRLQSIQEKPGAGYGKPTGLGINGRYVLTPAIFEAIDEIQRQGLTVKGETNLTDAMELLAKSEPFYAVRTDVPMYDSGHVIGYLEASVATALADAEHGAVVRERLSALLDAD